MRPLPSARYVPVVWKEVKVHRDNTLQVLVDSGALADPEKLPRVRRETRDLIERVAAEADVPVSVVWTKHDVAVKALYRSLTSDGSLSPARS